MQTQMNKILEGTIVSKGVFTGNVKVITDKKQLREVRSDDIMIVSSSHPSLAVGVMKAGGLICERGGRLAHICIVALEMGIPCLTGVKNASKILDAKKKIMLDADEGAVYDV
ncbi:MAG: hypothetical protein GY765_30255 [bacterium]|nr:hypothetical protein [bacterium]